MFDTDYIECDKMVNIVQISKLNLAKNYFIELSQ